MDKTLSKLLFSEAIGNISNDAVLVYMILRADISTSKTALARSYKKGRGRLASGLDVESISKQINSPLLSVKRFLDELVRRDWIKRLSPDDPIYELGYIKNFETGDPAAMSSIWYTNQITDKIPTTREGRSKASTIIRDMLDERETRKESARKTKASLSDKAMRHTANKSGMTSLVGDGLARESTEASKLLKWFIDYCGGCGIKIDIFKEEGNKSAKQVYQKTYSNLKKLVVWSGSDVDKASDYMKWSVDNWEKIKGHIGVMGDPTIGLLCTKSIFYKLSKFRIDGFPIKKSDGIGGRVERAKYELESEDKW